MTPGQRALTTMLGGGPSQTPLPHDEFLRRWPAEDGSILAEHLLQEGLDTRNGDIVAAGLNVAASFGLDQQAVAILNECAYGDWHQSHENITHMMRDMANPSSVSALKFLTEWVPDYLREDDLRVLAVNAVHALDAIGTTNARAVLDDLASSTDENIIRGLRDIGLLEDPEDVEWIHELAASDNPLYKEMLADYASRGQRNSLGARRGLRELGLLQEDHKSPPDPPV